MTIAHHSHAKAASLPLSDAAEAHAGSCEFLTPRARSRRAQQLAEQGYLVARVVPVFDGVDLDDDEEGEERSSMHGGPLRRGGLREALEGAVEISLALRGALPPSVDIDAPALTMARDQMFRVRTLEATGLCLVLPELSRLARDGALCNADSEALAIWKQMADVASVVVLISDDDRGLEMLAPSRLDDVFDYQRTRPAGWPDDERAAGSVPALDDLDDDVDDALETEALDDADMDAVDADFDDDVDDADDADFDDDAVELEAVLEVASVAGSADDDSCPDALLSIEAALASARGHDVRDLKGRVMPNDPLLGIDDLDDDFAADDSMPMQASLFDKVDENLQQTVELFSQPPPPPMAPAMVQAYCDDLDEARGPKSVKAIEELFMTRYTPLNEALCRGLNDDVARAVIRDWSAAFEKSYSESFTAMKVTGKRPSMVLDAPDIATRIARLNGARAVQLLLVDGMRYDLGQRVLHDLKQRIADRAVCVEQTLMWSALPTTTPTQMHLLARGPRALRDDAPPSGRETAIHRDGSVTTLRRVRIGNRDLVKLDVVEARLRDAGAPFDDRLDSIAREVSEVIDQYSESLPPRTLLFVFGDHGFELPVRAAGTTGPAKQGGATPEQVLVGGQAWLVGDVH